MSHDPTPLRHSSTYNRRHRTGRAKRWESEKHRRRRKPQIVIDGLHPLGRLVMGLLDVAGIHRQKKGTGDVD